MGLARLEQAPILWRSHKETEHSFENQDVHDAQQHDDDAPPRSGMRYVVGLFLTESDQRPERARSWADSLPNENLDPTQIARL